MRLLGHLLEQRTEKICGAKDPNLPYVGLEHLPSGSPDLLGFAEARESTSTNSVFEVGDVLFGKLRPNLRKCVLATIMGYCSTDILVLRSRPGIVAAFAVHACRSEDVWRTANRTAMGTKMPRTSWRGVGLTKVFCPEEGEQRRIAEMLDTFDESIRATERVVAKLEQTRQGLLNDLLTRGIDENGELRAPADSAVRTYDFAAMRVPSGWRVSTLGDLSIYIGSGITPRGGDAIYLREGGVLFIRSQNVHFAGLAVEGAVGISIEQHRAMQRSEVVAHDVLLNITGASIGRCCPMPDGLGPANVNQHVCAIRLPEARWQDALCLASVLASPIGQRQIDRLNAGSNRQGINYEQIGRIVVPWPESPCQRESIADRVRSINERVRAEEELLRKARNIRLGLSDTLLTGRVRVKVHEDAMP
jgi:type I restriction enzyme, S subunit